MTDPSGVEWNVSREWLSKPRWKGEWTGYPVDVELPDLDLGGDDEGGLVVVVLGALVVITVLLVLFFFWPLFSLLVALAVGGVVLVGRMVGLAPWTIRGRERRALARVARSRLSSQSSRDAPRRADARAGR